MDNPFVIGGIVVGVILVAIIVVNVVVASKRKKEVEELDRLFPEGNLSGEEMKIPVEKVRRTTMEREKRKKQRAHIPRERPKEGEKTLPDEDQEIILRPREDGSSQPRGETVPSRSRRARSEAVDTGTSAGKGRGNKDMDNTFAVRTTTRKARVDKSAGAGEQTGGTDATTSRRLLKKSLLKPERGEDLGETKPRTLINPSLFSGDEEKTN